MTRRFPIVYILSWTAMICWIHGRMRPPLINQERKHTIASYLYCSCPNCSDYLGIVIPKPPEPVEETTISGSCLRCGYKLHLKVCNKSAARESFGNGT